ncbi:MAG: DUF4417 domain-containing protein [Coriobacteriia bacterium]|nr:DUF4417 domain-containing protein [Coriobacteriia bacterium]MCL2750665.1 DUF4417 domain-containing protein [Coriobacteriia bacterium]
MHFYEHDQAFERLWNNPKRYIKILQRFAGSISPDFSLYPDMPHPYKQWNNYRNYACGVWFQSQGQLVSQADRELWWYWALARWKQGDSGLWTHHRRLG